MPFLIDRRRFLQQTLALGAASLAAPRFVLAAPKPEIHWAILSDTHIAADSNDSNRGFYPHKNLTHTLGLVQTAHASSPFDLMLINGDLARKEGLPADYEAFTAYLDPVVEKLPLAATLGNHDDRKNVRAALAKLAGDSQPVEQKLVSVIDAGPVDILLLDSLMVTNIAAGQLGYAQRVWLAEYLKGHTAKPVIIFVHHNLDETIDFSLVDTPEFMKIIVPSRSVKLVIYGHTHTWNKKVVDGIHLVNVPAVGYNFADDAPVGWVDSHFTAKSAKLKLNAIGGNMAPNNEVFDLKFR